MLFINVPNLPTLFQCLAHGSAEDPGANSWLCRLCALVRSGNVFLFRSSDNNLLVCHTRPTLSSHLSTLGTSWHSLKRSASSRAALAAAQLTSRKPAMNRWRKKSERGFSFDSLRLKAAALIPQYHGPRHSSCQFKPWMFALQYSSGDKILYDRMIVFIYALFKIKIDERP